MNLPTITAPADLAETIRGGATSRSRRLRYFLLIVVVLGAAASGFWWFRQQQMQHQPSAYITQPVHRGNLSLSITATGNIEPTNEVTIGSELSGTVLEVYVDINDRVKMGQQLAKLDTSKLSQTTESSRASLSSAKAKVLQAEATVRESEASLVRQRELHRISGGKMPSRSELDTAQATADRSKAELESARASVLQAEAQLKSNETDLQKAVLKSPIDGIVLTRTVEPGQTVAASFTAPELFTIAENLEHMELNVAIAEMDISRVEPGQTATFTVDAWPDRSFTATVKRVAFGSAIVDNVVTYETQLEVSNEDLSLRPGMTAVAEVKVAEQKDVLCVPNAALKFDPEIAASSAPGSSPPGGEKKTFVQSLMPGPPQSTGSRQSGSPPDQQTPTDRPGQREPRVWILRDGKPAAIAVKPGITDGRNTEISGPNVTEGMEVLVRANQSSL